MDNIALIGLPFYSLSKYRGMATAVTALRSAGISETLRKSAKHFTDMGDCHLSGITVDSGPPNLETFLSSSTIRKLCKKWRAGLGAMILSSASAGNALSLLARWRGSRIGSKGNLECSGWTPTATSTHPKQPVQASSVGCPSRSLVVAAKLTPERRTRTAVA